MQLKQLKIEASFVLSYINEKNVIFEVIDDGPGITQKYKKLVFKPGFTSKYDQTGTPSTGIGLSYIDEMVTELGGEVRLEDNENGNGCKFIVCLPECSLKREGNRFVLLYCR